MGPQPLFALLNGTLLVCCVQAGARCLSVLHISLCDTSSSYYFSLYNWNPPPPKIYIIQEEQTDSPRQPASAWQRREGREIRRERSKEKQDIWGVRMEKRRRDEEEKPDRWENFLELKGIRGSNWQRTTVGSVSWPPCSSFNGRFMFAGSLITYGRWIGGKDPEQELCLGDEEVWRSEVREGKESGLP